MARKRNYAWSANTPVPPLSKIQDAFHRGDLAIAINQIQEHHNSTPSPASADLYRNCLAAYLHEAVDRNDAANFDRFWTLTDALKKDAPEWPVTLANLLAKFGRLPQALKALPAEAPDAARTLLLHHMADYAVRFRTYTNLPDEHHDGCKTVILAFAKYDKGEDDAARELLNAIGIASPYLDWKLLLRGLMAHAAGDTAKAAENWQRLHPDRIPTKLAAPLRCAVDDAFRLSLPAAEQSRLQMRAAGLTTPKHLKTLQSLRAVVGHQQPLTPAWPDIQAAHTMLKLASPALAQRLRDVIYNAIIDQGEPHDVERYRTALGSPADDPDFHRLTASAMERIGQLPDSVKFWEKYEKWLAKQPAGWSAEQVAKARNVLFKHIGELALDLEHEDDRTDDLRQAFKKAFGQLMPVGSPLKKTAEEYFEMAAVHDPTDAEALFKIAEARMDKGDFAGAEAAARRVLERQPTFQNALNLRAVALMKLKRDDDALTAFTTALAGNPLDETLNGLFGLFVAAYARRLLAAGEFARIAPLLEQHDDVLMRRQPVTILTLRRTLGRLAGADVANIDERLAAQPNSRLAALYYALADANLANQKPAVKTAASKALTNAMAGPVTPLELNTLLMCQLNLQQNGIEFRGQKTFTAKIFAKIGDATVAGPLADNETLFMNLARMGEWKTINKHVMTGWKPGGKHESLRFLNDLAQAMVRGTRIPPHQMKYDAELSARTDAFGEFYREMKPQLNADPLGGFDLDDIFGAFDR